MSEQEKAEHIEAVKTQLAISDKTRVKTTIGTAVAICFFLIACTWRVCSYLDNIDSKISYAWSRSDMSSYAQALSAANTDVMRKNGNFGLIAPDPRLVELKGTSGE